MSGTIVVAPRAVAPPRNLRRVIAKSVAFFMGASPVSFVLSNDAQRRFLSVPRSQTGHLLDVFRIAVALHFDLRSGTFDLAQIVGRQFDCDRSDVLIEAREIGRAWNRNDPRLLGK